MSQLTTGEQISAARLRVDRLRRAMLAKLLLSPLLRWRYGAPIADELLIVPRDLRAGDSCFLDEFNAGQFGLAGFIAPLDHNGMPFGIRPPSLPWERELHGFSWLRHLRSPRTPEGDRGARDIVEYWIRKVRTGRGVAYEPAVVGRRIISWITCSHMLLDGDEQRRYDLLTDSLADQIIHLSATWRDAPEGYQRLLALTALLYADLCVAGRDKQLEGIEQQFATEVTHQILPDGGHISRNPAVLIGLLLDFLPLNQCFKSRNRQPPAALQSAVDRMLLMVQFMRLGDGTLARFNGVGPPEDDAVSTVMAYLPVDVPHLLVAPSSNYARLAAGDTVLIVDAGPPPPLPYSGDAHAGCLSFELSSGKQPIFVNGGAPSICNQDWRSASRATASHNSLVLGARSSARLVRSPLLEGLIGSLPLRYPEHVTAVQTKVPGSRSIALSHDGYYAAHGLLHKRLLTLSEAGHTFSGKDEICAPRGRARLARDLPFSIHFHLHRHATVELGRRPDSALITLRDGERWLFETEGAVLSLEDDVDYADLAGPSGREQIVLRGACAGEVAISWKLEKL